MSPETVLNNNSEKLKLEISPFIGGPQGSLDKSIEAGNVYYQTFIATIARGGGRRAGGGHSWECATDGTQHIDMIIEPILSVE